MKQKLTAFLFILFWKKFNSLILSCNYTQNILKWDKILINDYACLASIKGKFDLENDFITDVSHGHLSGQSSHDVKILSFVTDLKRIPKLGYKFFPKLEGFYASEIGLTEISGRDLIQLPSDLKIIYLYGNKLKQIPSDLFEFTPNLEYIALNNNQIKHVGYNFVSYLNLNKLKKFAINKNLCTDFPHILDRSKKMFEDLKTELKNNCKPTKQMIDDEARIEVVSLEMDMKI